MLQGICMLALPIKLFFSSLTAPICCCVFEIVQEHHLGFRTQSKWIDDILYPAQPPSSGAICRRCILNCGQKCTCAHILIWVCWEWACFSGLAPQSLEKFHSLAPSHSVMWQETLEEQGLTSVCLSAALFYFWIFINANFDICCVQCACFVTWSHPRGVTGITQRCLDFHSLSMEAPDAESH